MIVTIDARGLACPGPVLQTRKRLEEARPEKILIMVDNQASAENVCRYLTSQQYLAEMSAAGTDYHVLGQPDEKTALPSDTTFPASEAAFGDLVPMRVLILISSQFLGQGDEHLGGKLMLNFLNTLPEMGTELWHLVLVNSGVKLAVTEAPTLPALQQLESQGVTVLVCGTCLDHFNLLEQKQAGQTTNMLDIVSAMRLADKIITL